MEKRKIPYPVIVEGRYDRLRLENVIEARILTTDGFGLFNQEEKRKLFLALSKKTPLIVLTDSDGAGKLIRSKISTWIPKDRLIHLYTPRVKGKEKRKEHPSAEGILGVEGMEQTLLYDLFAPYENPDFALRIVENPITKTDFYLDGLTGGEDSRQKRDAFAEKLGLPAGMTPNALLSAVGILCTREEYLKIVDRK